MVSIIVGSGAGTGWTIYPPLSSIGFHRDPSVDYAILSLHVSGVSSILGGINFIATSLNMRSYLMEIKRIPLFV